MKIVLSKSLLRDLKRLSLALNRWDAEGRRKTEQTYRKYGLLWQAGAKRRVPVDEGRLEKGIHAPKPHWEGGLVLTQEVGTNVEYGPFLEFGTDRIAGGRVKALGEDPNITDQQAIHTWPAKEAEAIEGTSASIDTSGGAQGRLRNSSGRFVRAKPQEQMPWLRPAFMEIRDDLIAELDANYRPPEQT